MSPVHYVRALVVMIALAVGAGLPAPGAAARQDQDPAATQQTALSQLSTCVQEKAHLSVLMLIDESGSLANTDPTAQRVVAASAALNTLASLGTAEIAGTRPAVELALAAFGAEYTQVTDWALLDDSSRVGLMATLASFASRNTAVDTDFATALLGAELTLSHHREGLQAQSIEGCEALMIFTDGKLDIEARSTPETKDYAPDLPLDVAGNAELVEQRAISTMCDPGGVADRLRRAGTTTLGIALTSAIAPADRALIEALVTGTSSSAACGTPEPGAGQYLEAADLAGLLSTFDTVAGTISGGAVDAEQAVSACGGAPCASGTAGVPVDSSIRRLTVLVTSAAPSIQVHVTDPTDPDPVVFTRDGALTASTASADLTATWLSQSVLTLDIRSTVTPPPTGDWSFVVVDPSGSTGSGATLQATRYGNLFPRLAEDLRVTGNARTVSVIADIVDEFGVHLTALPATVVLNARLTDSTTGEALDVVLRPSSSGYLQGLVDLPATIGTSVVLTITLEAITDAGVALPRQSETTTHEIPPDTSGAETAVVNPDLPTEIGPQPEITDTGNSLLPSARMLLVVALLAAAGVLLFWVRRAQSARFTVDGAQWAIIPLVVKPNGALERLDRFSPLVIEPEDFRPLDVKDNISAFKLFDLRFRVRAPRHPFGTASGTVRADVPVAGSRGVFDELVHGRGIVDLALPGQWVFRIDEPATLASNRTPTDPHYGEVLGHLILFVPANHFKRPTSTLRRSLHEDLPAEARVLLRGAKVRNRALADRDAGNTLGLLQAMLGSGDEPPSFPIPEDLNRSGASEATSDSPGHRAGSL